MGQCGDDHHNRCPPFPAITPLQQAKQSADHIPCISIHLLSSFCRTVLLRRQQLYIDIDIGTDRMTTGSIAFDILVSTGLFILAMYGSIMGGSGQVKFTENGDLNQAMGVAPTQPTQQEEGRPGNEGKYEQKQESAEKLEDPESDAGAMIQYTESCAWVKWHFYMCIASVYIGMLVTNWTSASPTTGNLTSNDFGFWVRVAISWATTLLYIWTLIAPKVFP